MQTLGTSKELRTTYTLTCHYDQFWVCLLCSTDLELSAQFRSYHVFVCTFLLSVVGGFVEIQGANILANVLSFTWSTNISDIQNFAIVVINRKTKEVMNVFVKRNKRSYSLPVNSYLIALTAFDHCGQHFPSEKVLVINDDWTVDKLKPTEAVMDNICELCANSSSTSNTACDADNQENRAGN